jgi:gliding motility-associated-like protein
LYIFAKTKKSPNFVHKFNLIMTYYSNSVKKFAECSFNYFWISSIRVFLIASISIGISILFPGSVFSSAEAQDTIPPVITVPPMDAVYQCNTSNLITFLFEWVNNRAGMQAESESGQIELLSEIPDFVANQRFVASMDTLCGRNGIVIVGFFARDLVTNLFSDTIYATFSTFDNVRPVITSPVVNQNKDCQPGIRDTLIHWIQNHGFAQAMDNCSDSVEWRNFIWNSSSGQQGQGNIANGPYPQIPSGICDWSINVSFFVHDECGNNTPTTGSFRLIDNTPPIFSDQLEDITISCADIPDPMDITAFDDCSGETEINFTEVNTRSADSLSCGYYNYTITRTWLTVDNCNNTSEMLQVITVKDADGFSNFVIQDSIEINCLQIDSVDFDLLGIQNIGNCSPFEFEIENGPFTPGCVFSLERNYVFSDICGNDTTFTQSIRVIDNIAPIITVLAKDLSFSCEEPVNLQGELQAWIAQRAGAQAIDECNTVSFFAAIPGSYDIEDPNSFPGQMPGALGNLECPSPLQGFLRGMQVDFVFVDNCGNAVASTASFGIIDSVPPVISACQDSIEIMVTDNDCLTIANINVPTVTDNCSAPSSPVTQTVTVPVTSDIPGDPEVPVNEVIVTLGPFQSSNFITASGPEIIIELLNLDADNPTEIFRIYDENEVFLGTTVNTIDQCGSASMVINNISKEMLDEWLEDGFIQLRFEPNIPPNTPILAINDICINSRLRVSVSFEIDIESAVRGSYRIGEFITGNTSGLDNIQVALSSGVHDGFFQFEDCAGNLSECHFVVSVIDQSPPMIVCPPNVITTTEMDSCNALVELSLENLFVTDNCGFPLTRQLTAPIQQDNRLIVFSYNESLDTIMASNKVFNFVGLEPLRKVRQNPVLDIYLTGDITREHKFFTILGEGGTLIGTTQLSTESGQCGSSVSRFEIPSSLYDTWVMDGTLTITALANTGSFIDGGGINPCTILEPGQNSDGISTIYGVLSIYDTQIQYEVSGGTEISPTVLDQNLVELELLFEGGTSTLRIFAEDEAGNVGECNVQILVNDEQTPVASCKNAVIQAHPSGVESTTLTPELIDDQSMDNCRIESMFVNPSSFTCQDVGEQFNVTLVVTDQAGNSSSCESLVRVEPFVIIPDFSTGLCEGDTLRLFANLPETSNPVNYSIMWFKDGVLFSNEENPVIPNADATSNGIYTIEVTGFNNCVSTGAITINIQPLTTPEMELSAPVVCSGDQVLLTATSFQGMVNYSWYEGQFPDGILLATTTVPNFTINPSLGTHLYYVIAENPQCSSNPSTSKLLEVIDAPVAVVDNSFLSVCEGSDIILGTSVTGTGYQYHWTGPGGFSSNLQNPLPIENITLLNQGNYNLIIRLNECESNVATTQVVIFLKPATPVLEGPANLCDGADFLLRVINVTNGERYLWYRDGVLFRVTTSNELEINNVTGSLSGEWTVSVEMNNCLSDLSEIFELNVFDLLEVGASNTGPVCDGDSIRLMATFVPDANYDWSGPMGFVANGREIVLEAVPGEYSVTITTGAGCENSVSTTVSVVVPPSITALSNNGMECMEEGSSVQFFPTVFPTGNYNYTWSGPNNFNSSVLNPTLNNFTPDQNGVYTLTVFRDNCPSAPVSTTVNVNLIPPMPVIDGDTELCSGQNILLTTASTGNLYIWSTPMGTIETTSPQFELANAGQNNSGSYSLVVVRTPCMSDPSETVEINVVAQPAAPIISGTQQYCYGDEIVLDVLGAGIGDYVWEGPGGFEFVGLPLVIAFADESVAGDYRVLRRIGSCFSNSSLSFSVNVRPEITTAIPLLDTVELCITENPSFELCLNSASLTPGALYVLSLDVPEMSLNESSEPCFKINDLSELNIGLNTLNIFTTLGNCRALESSSVNVNLVVPPDIQAIAQLSENILCEDDFVDLLAANSTQELEVLWFSSQPQVMIANPTASSTMASGFVPGPNELILTYSKEACVNFSSDTVVVFLQSEAFLTDDFFNLDFNESTELDVFQNDILPEFFEIRITRQPQFGRVEVRDGQLFFVNDGRFTGNLEFEYTICPEACDELCTTARVTLSIAVDTDCFAPSIITPNGDGINDAFVIPCLTQSRFQNHRLIIFNQWGSEVFSSTSYQNDWEGTFGGKPLPAGTYYYVLEFRGSVNLDNIFGFLVIQR